MEHPESRDVTNNGDKSDISITTNMAMSVCLSAQWCGATASSWMIDLTQGFVLYTEVNKLDSTKYSE